MTSFVFPDNTVLCNYAAIERLDLLEDVLAGRGRWTAAVAYEASRSTRVLPALTAIEWLDDPIEITDELLVRRVTSIRRSVFGGSDADPLQHLGEAETCVLLREDQEFAGSWWVSDDREALRYARFQGITTRETIDLMGESVAKGDISAQQGFDLLQAMADCGRALRLPQRSDELSQ